MTIPFHKINLAANAATGKGKPATLKRASYREAIFWIANNDDTEFLNDEGCLSVTAALVVDLFGATEERVRADLIRAVAKARHDRT